MFRAAKARLSSSTIPSHPTSHPKLRLGSRLVKILILELVIVLVAGVAVPSLLWSHPTVGHALAAGSPNTLRLARTTFRYRYQDIEFATLGVLLGAAVAWTLYAPNRFTGKVAHFFQQLHARWFLSSQEQGRNRARKLASFSGS